ncbi:WbuC family cupin fold metalloprotein [Pseudoalteromonas luteoviolacea]|uniref:WbuC family cupin fold metalloprotein n=1 Tax=Pseudoalteromonas luteoviolacea TaxID=43657 RepID=UPI001F31BE5C|nr:WbuC family cupin fold metalloprotein [Pseudoalteromonas luteoviolacea]MCF6440349.1 WbuC family cupin fold metalloprotein [Pseudoalteromonas luteoviolacea]
MINAKQIDEPIIQLSSQHLCELKQLAKNSEIGRFRFCLHKDHEAAIQEMIICLYGDNYFAPHRHPEGVIESYHMIEGAMDVYTFNDEGSVIGCSALSALSHSSTEENSFFHKVTTPIYHTVVPRTEYVLYHEVLSGPWLPEHTSQVAPFAPDSSDDQAIKKFVENLNAFKK